MQRLHHTVHLGDCLDILVDMPDGAVDLVYLDPPYNTGQRQSSEQATYNDCWPSMLAYLEYMRPRIEQFHRVINPCGSILLHCDWRTCHHFRLMLDEVFGKHGFVNHLIWQYGLGGSSSRRFARKHDDILFYARSKEYYFAPPLVPATSNRMRGKLKKATDVLDIPAINNMAAERVGYPTQKPLALLELLVQACSPPGAIVLDPFCGSGTTLVAAQRTGRSWIGIDTHKQAVRIATTRLAEAGAAYTPA